MNILIYADICLKKYMHIHHKGLEEEIEVLEIIAFTSKRKRYLCIYMRKCISLFACFSLYTYRCMYTDRCFVDKLYISHDHFEKNSLVVVMAP
jgi:hypothetical protein